MPSTSSRSKYLYKLKRQETKGRCGIVTVGIIVGTCILITALVAAFLSKNLVSFGNGKTASNSMISTAATTTADIGSRTTGKPTSTPIKTSTTVKAMKPPTTTTTTSTTSTTTPTTTTTFSIPTNMTEGEGAWTDWGAWNQCGATCGEGVQKRYRRCYKVDPSDDQCQGEFVQNQICQSAECPVFGRWTTWAAWNSCSKSCGSGKQTRTRTCVKSNTSDIDCIGDPSMQQNCNTWNCPDCSRTCATGILNAACDTCVCAGNIATVKVVSAKGIPVYGASVYYPDVPANVISTSNEAGVAILDSVCAGAEVVIRKGAHQDTVVTIGSQTATVTMRLIEYPNFVEDPISKARRVGESATFCCIARGNPPIKYYEWFFGDTIIPRVAYPNGTHLHLTNLQAASTGMIKCRANSDVGAAFSGRATLTVKEKASAFCEDALETKYVSLPDGCFHGATNTSSYDVGMCNPKSCRHSNSQDDGSCGNTGNSVCRVKEKETVTVNCTDYTLPLVVVKSCGCADAVESRLTISGLAAGAENGGPLKNGTVLVDGNVQTYTSATGQFSVNVPATKAYVTLTFLDLHSKEYLDMTKRIILTGESVYVTVTMIKAADPITIDSSVENTVFAGTDPTDSSSPAEIIVPADSFYYPNGTQYTGSVKASFTFIDVADSSSDLYPGQFVFTNDEGDATDLESMGVFSIDMKDDDGADLTVSQPLTFSMKDNAAGDVTGEYELWGMNEKTSAWELQKSSTGTSARKKRTFKYTAFGSDYKWLNIDRATVSNFCYFRPIVYETSSLKIQSSIRTLRMYYYIKRGEGRAVYFWDTINMPKQVCFKVACDNEDGILDIFLNRGWYSTKDLNIFPAINFGYDISANGRLLNIRLVADDVNGPFFSTKEKCETSTDKGIVYFLKYSNSDVYTYKLVTGSTLDFQLESDYTEADDKVWFVNFGTVSSPYTRSCHLKVSIVNPPSQTVKIRVVSRVGTLSGYIGDVLGIREVEHTFNSTSNSTCVEYRCSYSLDITFVTVSLVYKLKEGEKACNVSAEEPAVVDAYDASGSNMDENKFEVYAPVDEVKGIYISEADGYLGTEEEKTKVVNEAIEACESVCNSASEATVTFTCPDRGGGGGGGGGWWFFG